MNIFSDNTLKCNNLKCIISDYNYRF